MTHITRLRDKILYHLLRGYTESLRFHDQLGDYECVCVRYDTFNYRDLGQKSFESEWNII